MDYPEYYKGCLTCRYYKECLVQITVHGDSTAPVDKQTLHCIKWTETNEVRNADEFQPIPNTK